MFLYHQKRKMITYVLIYFGCVTLVLILKPRNGTRPQKPSKACQSSLCPFPEETLTLRASSTGKPLCPQPLPWSVGTRALWLLGLALCHLHLQFPACRPASAQPAWGWDSRARAASSGGSCFLSPWDSAVTSTSRRGKHSVWGKWELGTSS